MPQIYIKVIKVIYPVGYLPSREKKTITAKLDNCREKSIIIAKGDAILVTNDIFSIALKELKKNTLVIKLKERGILMIDKTIASLKLQLELFPKHVVNIGWYKMSTKKTKEPFIIQLKVHIAEDAKAKPFNAIKNVNIVRHLDWEETFIAMQSNTYDEFNPIINYTDSLDEKESKHSSSSSEETFSMPTETFVPLLYRSSEPLCSILPYVTRTFDLS